MPRGEAALAAPSLHHHLLTGRTAEQRARVAQAITFFKQWRRFIVGSVGHLRTPPELIDRREGCLGLQLHRLGDDDTSLSLIGAFLAARFAGLDRFTAERGGLVNPVHRQQSREMVVLKAVQ